MSHQPSQPCPFCGSANISDGEVLTADVSGKTTTQSMCNDCGAFGPAAKLNEGEIDYGDVKAIAAWNTRAIASVMREPQWLPIDSAPKDGKMILVCLPRQMNLIVRSRYCCVHNYWLTDYKGEGGVAVPHFYHPGDLWQPMPVPPVTATTASRENLE